MPTRKASVKALRKNQARKLHNLDIKSDIRKTVKKFVGSVGQNNKEEAQATLKLIYKKFDKAAKRNIITKNTSSRRKSRYSRLLGKLSQPAAK